MAPTEGGGERPRRADLAELRLLRRALRNGWPVPAAARAKAVARMQELLDTDEAGGRAWAAAARTLVSMTRADLAAVDAAIRADVHQGLSGRVARLEAGMGDEHRGCGPPPGA
jgi:hypothetical protein